MGIPFVFAFAPIPLTDEQSPLLHAAIMVRRHQEQIPVVAKPRYRIKPGIADSRPALPADVKTSATAVSDNSQI